MKALISLSLLLAFHSQSVFAQTDAVGNFTRHTLANWNGDYIRISQYRVKGTPFFLGESLPGTITYKDGKSVSNVKVLYDLYHQRAGIDMQKNELFEEEHPIEQFVLELPEKFGGKKMLFVNADAYDSGAYKGYFNVLADGSEMALFKSYKMQLVVDPINNLAKDIRIFDLNEQYFLFNKKTKELRKIKLKEKDLLKDMSGNQQVKAFIKASGIDLSKENDAIKIVDYYNALEEK